MTGETKTNQHAVNTSLFTAIRDYLIEPSELITESDNRKKACNTTTCILLIQLIMGLAAIFTTGGTRGILGAAFYLMFGVYAICRTRYCRLGGIFGFSVTLAVVIGLIII